MTTTPRTDRWLSTTLSCIILGFFCFFLLIPAVFEFRDLDSLPADVVVPRLGFLLLQIPPGIVSLAALPFFLRSNGSGAKSTILGVLTVATGFAGALGAFAGFVATIELASRRSMTGALAAVIAAGMGTAASVLFDPDASQRSAVFVLFTLIVIFCLLVGVTKGRRREAAQLVSQKAQLNESILREHETRARYDERLAIARDMHDSLTHRLSLIAVHAGALEMRQDLSHRDLKAQASTIREQAAEAVNDLGEVLMVLRTEPTPIDPRLSVSELISQAQSSGQTVNLIFDGASSNSLSKLGITAQHTMHRMVQECLTNARKHAPGSAVQVKISAAEKLRIEVMNQTSNIPTGCNVYSAGVGLIGLRERAELCGGTLSVSQDPFTVVMELPCPQ